MSEELCFEFSDAFLKAGCCSLATCSKCFVFYLSFFRNLPVVTVFLLVCFFLFHGNTDAFFPALFLFLSSAFYLCVVILQPLLVSLPLKLYSMRY